MIFCVNLLGMTVVMSSSLSTLILFVQDVDCSDSESVFYVNFPWMCGCIIVEYIVTV